MNHKRDQRPKSAPNQKWRKHNGRWKHDALPIFIITGDDGLYQVQYRTPSSWTPRVAKDARNYKWYRLEVAKRIARHIETEMQQEARVG